MPHVDVSNESGLAYESLHVCDEAGVPVYVALLQATCAIRDNARVELLEKQPPPCVSGEWYGDPAASSLRLEPQVAFAKLGTDVVLLGHAYPTSRQRNTGQVGIRIGSVQKVAQVYGDRWLLGRSGLGQITAPEPFDKIPLVYERAFGGWDRRHADEARHRYEPRNPVGLGFRDPKLGADDDVQLPNIEDPHSPFRRLGDTPPPAGFGFVQSSWQPRAQYAGTYDEQWDKTRKPLLPVNFDRRFFNGAPADLISPHHLRGDETVVVIGATPEGRVTFMLPGISPPVCLVALRVGRPITLTSAVDTVTVDMDARTITLLWRAHLRLRNGPHDVMAVEVSPHPALDDEVAT